MFSLLLKDLISDFYWSFLRAFHLGQLLSWWQGTCILLLITDQTGIPLRIYLNALVCTRALIFGFQMSQVWMAVVNCINFAVFTQWRFIRIVVRLHVQLLLKSSTCRELLRIKLAVESLGPVLKHQQVQFCSDSQNTLKILEKGSRKEYLHELTMAVFSACDKFNIKMQLHLCLELRMSRLISFPGL